ncbi:MAG: DUF1579 family protein [Acidobacteria bacterium]|nr:DUF1579 family protein [Acidobacteriota bacterium]
MNLVPRSRVPRSLATALLVSAVLMAPAVFAQEEPDGGPTPEEQQEMLARAQAIAQPGPEHRLLEKLAGHWRMAVKIWGPPGQPPKSLTGESDQTMILGGRFLEVRAKSEESQGQHIESLVIYGYDRRLDLYTMTGFDNLGTYSIEAEGVVDEETGTVDLEGTTLDPMSGDASSYRFELHPLSEDVYTVSLYFETPDGDDVLLMETTYTRVP